MSVAMTGDDGVPTIDDWNRLLEGRVAVVTGGGDGIGAGIARLFAQHGALRRSRRGRSGTRGSASTTKCPAQADRSAAMSSTSPPTTMSPGWPKPCSPNTAGPTCWSTTSATIGPWCHFSDSTPESWQQQYDINLRHVFAVTRAFVPSMIDAHRGSIVTVHSVEGMRGYPKDPVYGAMKAAAAHFTTCLAVDLGRHGIRVNGIGTDLAQTPQVDYLTGYEDVDDLWASWAPVGRVGWPEDQARVALFLASDQSAFVTGHNIPVDGGTKAGGGWLFSPTGGPLRQQIEEPVTTTSDADETVDVLVVGSAGALAGAYTAAREGLSVAIVEATDQFGGTFAYSGGGGMWYPCNPVLVRAGVDDTIDEALRYYRTVVGDRTPAELQETYVRGAFGTDRVSRSRRTLRVQDPAVAGLLQLSPRCAQRRYASYRLEGGAGRTARAIPGAGPWAAGSRTPRRTAAGPAHRWAGSGGSLSLGDGRQPRRGRLSEHQPRRVDRRGRPGHRWGCRVRREAADDQGASRSPAGRGRIRAERGDAGRIRRSGNGIGHHGCAR